MRSRKVLSSLSTRRSQTKAQGRPLTVEFTPTDLLLILEDYLMEHLADDDVPTGHHTVHLLIDGADALTTHERIEVVFRPKDAAAS